MHIVELEAFLGGRHQRRAATRQEHHEQVFRAQTLCDLEEPPGRALAVDVGVRVGAAQDSRRLLDLCRYGDAVRREDEDLARPGGHRVEPSCGKSGGSLADRHHYTAAAGLGQGFAADKHLADGVLNLVGHEIFGPHRRDGGVEGRERVPPHPVDRHHSRQCN